MARIDVNAAALATAKKGYTGFAHDRSQTVGASEIAGCIKKTGMKKQGVKPDADYVDDPGFAVRGNLIEDHWAVPVLTKAVEASGGQMLWAGQANQTTVEWKKRYASCTPDGLFVDVPPDWLAGLGVKKCGSSVLSEIKSIDPRIAPDRLPKEGHAEQAHYGMGLVRAATDYKPEYALLTYWNCSKLTDHWPLVVKYNDEYFQRQLARAKKAITTPWQKLIPEGRALKAGKPCSMCEYAIQCQGKRATRSPDKRQPPVTLIDLGAPKKNVDKGRGT